MELTLFSQLAEHGALGSGQPAIEHAALLRRWRELLTQVQYTSTQIERSMSAIRAASEALGPTRRWSEARLRRYEQHRHPMPQRRKALSDRQPARATRASIEALAVRRFYRFTRMPEKKSLLMELVGALMRRQRVGKANTAASCAQLRDKIFLFDDDQGSFFDASMITFDAYGTRRVASSIALSTLRKDHIAVRTFNSFIFDPANGFIERIRAVTGRDPFYVCTAENSLIHASSARIGEISRELRDDELETLFGDVERRMERKRFRKEYWTFWRDHAMYGFMLATGARCSCLGNARLHDLEPAYSEVAAFSPYEHITFYGKGMAGAGGAKPRIVPAIGLFASGWVELRRYIEIVRPHFVKPHSGDAIFLNERGDPVTSNEVSSRFTEIRQRAGLSDELHAHCLRHTFAMRLRRAGVSRSTIAAILGHESEETTKIYVPESPEDMQQELLALCRRRFRTTYA
jgi:integrase/recombinase XerD